MRYGIILFVLLAGCATPEEKAREAALHEQQRAEAYRAHVEGQCRGYGFTAGTPEYRNCLMQIDMANRQQNEAQRQMMLQQYLQGQGVFRR